MITKILGGFTEYRSPNSEEIYGRRFEWGAFQGGNYSTYISYVTLLHGFCTLDMGLGYCYLKLVILSNTNYTGPGYDIRGGYIQFVDDGSIAMNWGVNYTSPGFTDTVVYSGEAVTSIGVRDANLHFMLETIDELFQFSDISKQKCNITTDETQSHCKNEIFTSQLGERTSTSIAHEFARFRCWSIEWGQSTFCKSFIWM